MFGFCMSKVTALYNYHPKIQKRIVLEQDYYSGLQLMIDLKVSKHPGQIPISRQVISIAWILVTNIIEVYTVVDHLLLSVQGCITNENTTHLTG